MVDEEGRKRDLGPRKFLRRNSKISVRGGMRVKHVMLFFLTENVNHRAMIHWGDSQG